MKLKDGKKLPFLFRHLFILYDNGKYKENLENKTLKMMDYLDETMKYPNKGHPGNQKFRFINSCPLFGDLIYIFLTTFQK